MGTTIDDLARLKQKAEKLQSQKDRAQGALDETKETLKKEFQCESLGDAKKLLSKLEEELEEKQMAFDGALEEFGKEFEDALR
uniref:Uncharacterized protein n=1 Tax=viral metagenome TaxID=1070528 RepID=A0A6M3K0Z6_9ZZZZ